MKNASRSFLMVVLEFIVWCILTILQYHSNTDWVNKIAVKVINKELPI